MVQTAKSFEIESRIARFGDLFNRLFNRSVDDPLIARGMVP
jgi:hypothetical protein